ncbi:MAG: hypothetical protein K0R44_3543 [Thermomicrobiales bacterium]|nr:hypothetical protein [Thermomicrobiales bacterium]
MDSRQDRFQRLLREAQDDPQIIGLVLTGSRGKGFGSEVSDFDVLLVVQPLCNDRYSFANVSVLLDKTGQVQRLVEEKGGIPDERRLPIVVTALDAYINSVYRSLKCLRNGNGLGARLEAADAIGHALTVVFALEGRHRPYYGYLARELEAHPLANFPLPADELLAMLSAILERADAGTQQRLLGIIDTLGRQAGCGEVFEEWESDYVWMQQYRPPNATP